VGRLGVGIIGCGNIAPIYLENSKKFANLCLIGCADMDPSRARARAEEFETEAFGVRELIEHPEVDIVINLTVPQAHGPISLQSLEAGKHVYSEKPFGLSREEGQAILKLAAERGLKTGCAPDTFLGSGLQTCRELVDEGAIGRPIAATAFMLGFGPEGWHPDPEFFYAKGGGPMLDMGPYYLTALVHLLGSIRSIAGASTKGYMERVIGSGPKKGNKIPVQIDTHLAGTLMFESGVIGTLATSFDVHAAEVPIMEIYGTEGTLSVPDPNSFGGPVRVWREGDWTEVPLTRAYAENSRGLGVADLASAIQNDRPARASGELAYHVLDAMLTFHDLGPSGGNLRLTSAVDRPEPLPRDLQPFEID
jgi:predicted dehydrogenase